MSAKFYRIGVYMQATRFPNAFSSFIIYSVREGGGGGGGYSGVETEGGGGDIKTSVPYLWVLSATTGKRRQAHPRRTSHGDAISLSGPQGRSLGVKNDCALTLFST